MKVPKPHRALYCRICDVCDMIDPCVAVSVPDVPCTKWTC